MSNNKPRVADTIDPLPYAEQRRSLHETTEQALARIDRRMAPAKGHYNVR